ncbi:7784_t:CDS:2, partial [Scutellospora calospora]
KNKTYQIKESIDKAFIAFKKNIKHPKRTLVAGLAATHLAAGGVGYQLGKHNSNDICQAPFANPTDFLPLTSDLSKCKDENDLNIQVINRLYQTNQEKDNKISELLLKNKEEISQLTANLDKAEKHNLQLEKQIKEHLSNKTTQPETTIVNLENVKNQVEIQLQKTQADLTQEQNERNTIRTNLPKHKPNLQQAQHDLTTTQNESKAQVQEISQKDHHLKNVENKLPKQDQELNEEKQKRQQAEQERNDLQNQLNNHVCPILASHACSPCGLNHYQNANQASEQKEQQILHQINQSLNLNLKEPNLEQLITKIKELINKPPETIYAEFSNDELENKLNQAQETIIRLEKELGENNTPFGESLENIKEIDLNLLEKELNIKLSPESIQKIKAANSYQQLSQIKSSEIKKHLQQNLNNLEAIQPREIYNVLNKPTIDDKIYDQTFQELKELETNLESTDKYEELEKFEERIKKKLGLKQIEYLCELKIDEDVSINLSLIQDLPNTLPQNLELSPPGETRENIEIRGEIYMKKAEFQRLNEGLKKKGLPPLANPRNAAAGTLRTLIPTQQRRLHFFAYQILGTDAIKTYFQEIEKQRSNLEFEIDGIVIKVEITRSGRVSYVAQITQ